MPEPASEEDLLTSFDTTVAHPARVWDFLLGGKDNFAADRTAGEQVLRIMPEMGLVARGGREFLARAVHHLAAEAGIRQFLDIGTGLPTADNTGTDTYNEHSAVSIIPRTEAQMNQFFAGLELVSPGLTPLGHGRTGAVSVGALPLLPTYTAVGRKP